MSSALNIEIVIPQLAEKGGLDQIVNDFADYVKAKNDMELRIVQLVDTAESYAAYLESAEIKPDAKTCRESVTEFELNYTFEKMCGDIKALYDVCID